MQAIPLFAWMLAAFTSWADGRRRRFVVAASASYLALFALLLGEALSGVSVVSSSALNAVVWVAWAAITGVCFAWASWVTGEAVRGRSVNDRMPKTAHASLRSRL
jgi:hypothetical protein